MQEIINRWLKVFPELAQIKDKELRRKCCQCWQVGVERGGWQVEDLAKIPFTLLIPDCPVDFITHIRAVTVTAINIANTFNQFYPGENLDLNRDHLVAGAILHDLGKLLEFTRQDGKLVRSEHGKLLRHPISGANLAAELGIPPEIIHVIAGHSKEGETLPRSLISIIVHHADFVNYHTIKAKAETAIE